MKRWEYCNKRRYYAFATNLLYGHIMLLPKKIFFLPLPKKNASCCFYTGYYEVSRILWWTSLLWFCDKPISWQYHTFPQKNNIFWLFGKKWLSVAVILDIIMWRDITMTFVIVRLGQSYFMVISYSSQKSEEDESVWMNISACQNIYWRISCHSKRLRWPHLLFWVS